MALRYWVGGNGIWNATAGTKWSLTSGGTGGASVPTSADDVFLDNGTGTGNVTLGTGYAATAKTLNCTGYVGTLASTDTTGTLTVSGAVTFVAGMTITATNTLVLNATATQTSGGKTWTGNLTLNQFTHTLADSWTVSGTLRTVVSNDNITINGNSIDCNGLNTSGTTFNVLGTTNINLRSGTWQSGGSILRNNLTFNSSTSITISGNVYYNTGTITYTAGTITTTGSTLNINGATTLNLSTMQINNLTIINNPTITLSSSLICDGTLSITNNNGNTTINGATLTISVGGSLRFGGAFNVGGTIAGITMNGTGTWSESSTCALRIPLTFNTLGTITISGNVYIQTGCNVTWTAGTIVSTGSTVNAAVAAVAENITLNIPSSYVSLNNVTITGYGTITLGANLIGVGTLTINPISTVSITFLGSFGWNFVNFSSTNTSTNIILVPGQTYTINGGTMTTLGSAGGRITIRSSTTTKAILTLFGGVRQSNTYLNGTYIDSSLGNTVYTWLGTLSNTINWNVGAQPNGTSYISIN